MEKIITIFTSKDEDDLKSSLKDLLIEQFKDDLKDNGNYNYLFNRDRLSNLANQAFEEVVGEMKEELRKIMFSELDKIDIKEMLSLALKHKN